MTPRGKAFERPPMFRRRRFKASHQRPGLLTSILRPLSVAFLVVGLPAGLATWALTSPRFALAEIEVESGDNVSRQWVAESLAPLRGRHVLLLSLPEVEALLDDHQWIAGVAVQKKLPHGLMVRILERIPVAIVSRDDGLHYVDRDGLAIDRLAGDELPAALLLIEGQTGEAAVIAAAVAAIDELAASDSSIFQAVEQIELLGGFDLKLRPIGLPFTVLLRADRLQPAVHRFEQLLPKIIHRYDGLQAVDLRFTRQIVMQFLEA